MCVVVWLRCSVVFSVLFCVVHVSTAASTAAIISTPAWVIATSAADIIVSYMPAFSFKMTSLSTVKAYRSGVSTIVRTTINLSASSTLATALGCEISQLCLQLGDVCLHLINLHGFKCFGLWIVVFS